MTVAHRSAKVADDLVARALVTLLAGGGQPSGGLDEMCELICIAGLADVVQVYGLEPDAVHLRSLAVAAVSPHLADEIRSAVSGTVVRLDSTIAGSAAGSSGPIVVNDFPDHLDAVGAEDLLHGAARAGVRHVVGVPVPSTGGTIGSMLASRISTAAPFDTHDIELLTRVASLAGYAVERAALLNRVARQADLLDRVADAVIAIDENWVVTKWNHGAEVIYDIPRAEAMGSVLTDLFTTVSHTKDTLDEGWTELRRDSSWRDSVRQITRRGRVVEVEAVVTPVKDTATGFAGAVAVNRDVSQALRAQRALAERQEFAEAVLDAIPGRTVVVDVGGRVRAVNVRYQHEGPFGGGAGSGPDVGADWLAFLAVLAHSTPGIGVLSESLKATLLGAVGAPPVDIPGPQGHWTAAQVTPFRGPGGGALVSFTDVSDRKARELELAYDATHDPLTGLPNRALLLDRITAGVARAYRRGEFVAVLFVDLDDLKATNDAAGHSAGDQVIVRAAHRLGAACRSCDTVARLGGDEFVVVLEEMASRAEAEPMALRIMDRLASAGPDDDRRLAGPGIRASVGVAVTHGHSEESADSLVRRADLAMLIAKRQGKGRVVVDDAGALDGVGQPDVVERGDTLP